MNPVLIKQNIGEEIFRNVKARFQKNGENINRDEIIEESAYCMAVNIEILKRKLPQNFIPENIEELFMEGITKKLSEIFPRDFNETYKSSIQSKFNLISKHPLKVYEINNHYNELYGPAGGNVL